VCKSLAYGGDRTHCKVEKVELAVGIAASAWRFAEHLYLGFLIQKIGLNKLPTIIFGD